MKAVLSRLSDIPWLLGEASHTFTALQASSKSFAYFSGPQEGAEELKSLQSPEHFCMDLGRLQDTRYDDGNQALPIRAAAHRREVTDGSFL